jgi:hypothetical protein
MAFGDIPVTALECNNSQEIESNSDCQGPSDEPDEEERELLASVWDQETENYFREVSDELHRQLSNELDYAIQKELDAQMEEQLRTYFEHEQEKLRDEELALALDVMLGFQTTRHISPVTIADVDATITQVVQDYLANQTDGTI